jgi:NAD(P)-dependent dehydrogenase (short-subunit alcohol dehydrogenase family)
MGRALARLMAERGDALCLLGRDVDELESSARDFLARGARGPLATERFDLAEPAGFAAALEAADRALGGFDALVVTAGDFAPQEASSVIRRGSAPPDLNHGDSGVASGLPSARRAVAAPSAPSARSPVTGRGGATTSTARQGRTRPSSRDFTAYADGGVRVVCVRPGFVKTAMGLPSCPSRASPKVAPACCARRPRAPVVYARRSGASSCSPSGCLRPSARLRF